MMFDFCVRFTQNSQSRPIMNIHHWRRNSMRSSCA